MLIPEWQKEVRRIYKSNISNTFMLTGNIGDYTCVGYYLKDYLINLLLTNRVDCEEDFHLEDVYIYDPHSLGSSVKSKEKELNLETILTKMCECDNRKPGNAFIFYYPEYIIPAGDFIQEQDKKNIVAIHSVINSSKFIQSNNIAFFITESTANIHPMFLGNNSKISLINIELPDLDTRIDFVKDWYDKHEDVYASIDRKIDIKTIANLTAGLQLVSIEDILLEAKQINEINSKMILEKKKEIIRKEFGEVIEIFDTEGLSLKNFAGQDNIKSYFKETVIDAMRDGDLDIVPKGVLLMGPPGTGKTYFAKCLAGDSGISFVEFKLSKILGKYVGESEKSMEKALQVFRALAPCGVFMDEIDQSMSRGQGGSDGASSVNANLFGMLLAEMSKPSNRGKILWFAATNYPNNVDEALKRPGRFDKKIPFFAPTKDERESIFKLRFESDSSLPVGDDVDYKYLVEHTDGYTQAEIEGIVLKARELAKRKKKGAITQDIVQQAVGYMLSNQNEKIREMEDIALRECNDQEFIPEKYKERQKKLLTVENVNTSVNHIDRGGFSGR